MKYSNYFVDGIARDQDWIVKNQSYLEDELYKDMRAHGYIPVLDIAPVVTWEFMRKEKTFRFKMVAQGLKVGVEKSRDSVGILSKEGILLGKDSEPSLV